MPLPSLKRAHAPAFCPPPQVPEDERVDYEESESDDDSKQPAAAQAPSSEARLPIASEVRPLTASEARPFTASEARPLTASKARPHPASEARPFTASKARSPTAIEVEDPDAPTRSAAVSQRERRPHPPLCSLALLPCPW
eukprot:1307275-Pleurochrysis_carterae.AAC.1